jgi:AAA+ ATPase superfamily predicted ATPase
LFADFTKRNIRVFTGRKTELKILNEAYRSGKSELVVIYGRRRIGKSSLVKVFSKDKRQFFSFEAIEGEGTQVQIRHFTAQLKKQYDDPVLENARFSSWENVFSYLTDRIINNKTPKVIFLDELPWMAAGRSRLVSLLKFYWDNHWKEKKVMLILCGSVASFMVKKVLKSKALYGRITLDMLLKGLRAEDAYALMGRKRSKEEALKYLLVFGGVPKYLEDINPNRSFNQNINRLCFSPHSTMIHEVGRIFYSQFRETRSYLKIINLLKDGIFTANEISEKAVIPSGGGLKLYLDNLEQAEIIRNLIPFDKGSRTKFKKYALSDEFLIFYFKYIQPNERTISESSSNRLFETLTRKGFESWLGFAFERFCLKNAYPLAQIMGFDKDMLLAAPYFERKDRHFQIDLLYKRADRVITVCEVKHQNSKIGTKVIPEMERKCTLLKTPRGYALEKALISLYGPDNALLDSDYFNYVVTLEDLFPDH